MGLLQKLLSTLGLRESSTGRGSERAGETTVTVEHEPDTASESAVKGTDGATTSTSASASADTAAEPAAEDAGASEAAETASSTDNTDEAGAAAEIEEAEPDEAESAEPEGTTEAAAETETDTETATADDESDSADAAGSDESTDVLNGIGPAYAERLENAGVETVADLAGADAADLADETGLGEGRISNWIEQAKDY